MAAMLIGSSSLLFERQRNSLYSAALQQSKSLTVSIASSTSWVPTNNIAGLKEVLQGYVGLPGLERAYIISLNGEVLSSTRSEEIGLFFTDEQTQKLLNSPVKSQVLFANNQKIDIAAPIMTGERHVGWARVEMTINGINDNLRFIVVIETNFILFAVLGLLVAEKLFDQRVSKKADRMMRIAAEPESEYDFRILAAAFESQEGILVTDANYIILRANKSFCRSTGYRDDEIIGKAANIFKSERQNRQFYISMCETIQRDNYWQGEIWNKRKNGAIYPEWLCITAITNPEGEITNYVGTFTDISQRKADEERIKDLAYYDPLTKLPNRTLLFDRLSFALNTSHRNRTYGALMFIDLDNFQTLNDTLGHDKGDQLLIEVGLLLQSCVREVDTVARLGGDEFVIMLESLDEQEFEAAIQAYAVAEKIRNSLAKFYRLKTTVGHAGSLPAATLPPSLAVEDELQSFVEHYSTGSIGFVLFLGHETSSEELLKRADLAMYQAKQAGRNVIRAFVPEMQESLNLRASLEADLRNALDRNELSLHYQVQVDVTGKPVGAEALIRWNQPERGMISPAEFIPLAEETGLILPIGHWILKQGCNTLAEWAKYPEARELKLAVNISSLQLGQADFVEQMLTILAETGANPALLKLEITESVTLGNVEDTIEKMHAVIDLGVSFSMDDFGTGYSSLSYLQKLPLEQLKIDQSFVKNMAFNNHDSAIVRTILALGKNLELNIIAEGVETEVQREYLAGYGCLVFQGYLFGRTVPADQFIQNLLSGQAGKLTHGLEFPHGVNNL